MDNERENERMAKAYTETLIILSWVGKEYKDKIPEKFIKFLEENKDKNYVPKINPISLLQFLLKPKTFLTSFKPTLNFFKQSYNNIFLFYY